MVDSAQLRTIRDRALDARAAFSLRRDLSSYERWFKPVIDRAVGVLVSIITLPIVVILAIAIFVTTGRPVLFKQRRVGLGGTEFTVYKFRTMTADRRVTNGGWSGPDRRKNHKSEDDPRHTTVGRFLRKWSLDEIPQFWNVALGHMSLVGPRPELVEIVARYEPWQHRRHQVKPGITGLWQVSERGETPMHEATDVDLEYVDQLSPRVDLAILLRTIPAVLSRTGS